MHDDWVFERGAGAAPFAALATRRAHMGAHVPLQLVAAAEALDAAWEVARVRFLASVRADVAPLVLEAVEALAAHIALERPVVAFLLRDSHLCSRSDYNASVSRFLSFSTAAHDKLVCGATASMRRMFVRRKEFTRDFKPYVFFYLLCAGTCWHQLQC